MNYLAHAYLSFRQPEILVGNMISDYIKGKKKFDYAPRIQQGIMLHRAIDDFTDRHEMTHKAKQVFRPVYGLYAGAFMDIVYDHFLANDTNEFADAAALQAFSTDTYRQLEDYAAVFPERFQRMFPSMKQHNWLYHYQFKTGISRSFEGLVYRAKYLSESASAFEMFEKHYDELQLCYAAFFPELKKFTVYQLHNL